MVVVNSSAEASTSAFQSGEGDGNEAMGITLSKKKSRSPVWHFFKPTEQRSSKGILLAKCTLCVPPKPAALIGINIATNMIQHLLRKHKREYIVDIRTGQKVIMLILYFNSFEFELNVLLFPQLHRWHVILRASQSPSQDNNL